jgi:hypothetical protein
MELFFGQVSTFKVDFGGLPITQPEETRNSLRQSRRGQEPRPWEGRGEPWRGEGFVTRAVLTVDKRQSNQTS